jgi:hypothetical protein
LQQFLAGSITPLFLNQQAQPYKDFQVALQRHTGKPLVRLDNFGMSDKDVLCGQELVAGYVVGKLASALLYFFRF